MCGMIFDKSAEDSSKQGLELTSMSQALKFSSIMKSRPNISMQFSRLSGSILPYTAFIESVARFFYIYKDKIFFRK
jgi:hypothetical protein